MSNESRKKVMCQNVKKKVGVSKKKKNDVAVNLVDYWNTLPEVRKHKKRNSAVFKKSVQRIDDLLSGKYMKYSYDPEWERRTVGSVKRLGKFTPRQIERTFDEMALLFKEGYFPLDKKSIPRNLCDLIYNPFTRKSWFIWVYTNGVPMVSDPIVERNISNLDSDVREVFEYFLEEVVAARQAYYPGEAVDIVALKNDLYYVFKDLEKFYYKKLFFKNRRIYTFFPDLLDFLWEFIKFTLAHVDRKSLAELAGRALKKKKLMKKFLETV